MTRGLYIISAYSDWRMHHSISSIVGTALWTRLWVIFMIEFWHDVDDDMLSCEDTLVVQDKITVIVRINSKMYTIVTSRV